MNEKQKLAMELYSTYRKELFKEGINLPLYFELPENEQKVWEKVGEEAEKNLLPKEEN